MAKLKDPHVQSDTDWQTSSIARPMRGYHDYTRTIVFVAGTDPKVQKDTIDAVMAPYKYKGGPTWSNSSKFDDHSWFLRQGYDSGD